MLPIEGFNPIKINIWAPPPRGGGAQFYISKLPMKGFNPIKKEIRESKTMTKNDKDVVLSTLEK